MNVRTWTCDNYDSESVFRRAVASWVVVTVEWSLSAAISLLPLMVLYAVLDGWLVDWSVQIWTLVWVALTVLVLLEVEGFTRRRLFDLDGLTPGAGE